MSERYSFRTTKHEADRIIDEDLEKYPRKNGAQSARIRALIRLGLQAEMSHKMQVLKIEVPPDQVKSYAREWDDIMKSQFPRTIGVNVYDTLNAAPAEQLQTRHSTPTKDQVTQNLLEDDFE